MPDPSVNPVRLQLLLDQAMGQPEPERAAFVRRASGGDAALCAAALAQLALQTSSRPKARFFSSGRDAAADADQRLPAELQGLRVGQRIGDFTLVRFLGKGGMGQVWEARQESLKKHVALKLLLSDRIDDRALELFVREARAGGKCHHPNLVATLSRGEDQGIAWLAQELVADAQTLADALERFRGLDQLPQGYHRQVASLVEKVARGMQAAHDAGVVHRDLKPQNILIGGDDEPRVVDFGLARVTGDSVASKTGDFAGTYFYMSPEQVMAKRAGLDHRTDVFSLGVVLYELLTLQRPFLGDTGQQIAQQITTWDPPRADTVRSQCPRDLGVIAEKAMQKASSQRYPSMGALAEDLHRYLSDLPILAKPTGRLERARKWVRRNPTVSATMGSVFAGAVVAGTLAWQNAALARAEAAAKERAIQNEQRAVANEQRAVASEQVAAQRAEENARLAAAETKAKEQAAQLAAAEGRAREEAQRTVSNFNQLSAVVRLKAAQASQAALWLSEDDTKGWPAKVEALERWLAGPCAELLAQRPQLEATVGELRAKALPRTEAEVAADRRTAPELAAYNRQQLLVQSLLRADRIQRGELPLALPPLPEELQGANAMRLNDYAWERVAPEAEAAAEQIRTVFGEEDKGLVAARAAVARGLAGDQSAILCGIHETLAWALVANGQYSEVEAAADAGIASVAPSRTKHRMEHEKQKLRMLSAITEAGSRLTAAESWLSELESRVSMQRTWRFSADTDGESSRFLHDALVGVLAELEGLESRERVDVELRLSWARQLASLPPDHPQSRHTWAAVRAALAKADGVVSSTLYAGRPIVVPEAGWVGLVPIGMNPVTQLWEFYDLRSAWDGQQAAAELAIPEHRGDGSIELTESTGIVFVLLPGGEVTLGSQKEDPSAPFYVAQRTGNHTDLRKAALEPFFLSRYELTQGQWSRLQTWDEALRRPSGYGAGGDNYVGGRITGMHPVENVDWNMSRELLSRHGLRLPSEDEWEYGCRGGTTTPWQVGLEALGTVANLSDQTAKQDGAPWGVFESWEDGHVVHAPVGSFLANAYGLHDMHGNVAEWCGDVLQDNAGAPRRVYRGGSFGDEAQYAQSSYRYGFGPTSRRHGLGLRPAKTSRP